MCLWFSWVPPVNMVLISMKLNGEIKLRADTMASTTRPSTTHRHTQSSFNRMSRFFWFVNMYNNIQGGIFLIRLKE